jgi:alkane 1-monooxygenase
MFGVIAGGPWVWTGVFFLGLGIVIDVTTPVLTRGAGMDAKGDFYGNATLLNWTMYAMLGVFVLLQLAIAARIWEYTHSIAYTGATAEFLGFTYYTGITGIQLVGAVISTGIFAGIGIIYGHELAHTKGFSFVIARWMMALSGKADFCYAHVYNHHLELACDDDPATAPRGRSLYNHYAKADLGQRKFLYVMEEQRLKRLGKPFFSWENRWIRGYAMALPTIFLFWYVGGFVGIACMMMIWMISNFELEALNYLEHYGLIREKGQPIDYRHSWDNSTAFTSWFFIEIGRQADHHDRGETHFWELDEVGAPNCGNGYFTLYAMALIPPIFHMYMEKQLKIWDETEASEGERKIANEINKIAGYA